MKRYWIIGIMMGAGLPVQAQDCRVNVHILTSVALTNRVFLDPRVQVSAMFRRIGVDVRLRMGSPARDVTDACGAPIVVKFDESTGYPGGADALAYAMPYTDSGACIHILIDRVLDRNRDQGLASAVLAHVMVHEISHVLERSTQHSETGVMKARWSTEDIQRMQLGPLPFAAEDVERIRQGVARRIADGVPST